MSATKIVKKSKGRSIADKIVPVGEIPNYTAALFYGESGTGKTTVAASFPKPLLLLDLREKGTETIAKYKGIDVLPVEEWKEFEEAFWMLDSDSKYETIVLDQVSALQALGMDKIRIDERMEPGDTFSRRDWGTLSGLMQTWLLNYRNLWSKEKHIVFLAHQRQFGGEDDETEDGQIAPRFGARLSPSVESFLNGAVSTIGNTFIRERWVAENPKKPGKKTRHVDYCMRVGPHANFRTKVRKDPEDAVPDILVNPTFEKIMRLSRGEGLVKKVRK